VYDFLFVIIELFSLALAVDALQGKQCQNSLLPGGVGQFELTFQGKRSSLGDLFWLTENKTHFAIFHENASSCVLSF